MILDRCKGVRPLVVTAITFDESFQGVQHCRNDRSSVKSPACWQLPSVTLLPCSFQGNRSVGLKKAYATQRFRFLTVFLKKRTNICAAQRNVTYIDAYGLGFIYCRVVTHLTGCPWVRVLNSIVTIQAIFVALPLSLFASFLFISCRKQSFHSS